MIQVHVITIEQPRKRKEWIGLGAIAAAWVFVFLALFLAPDESDPLAGLFLILGVMLIGFGVGWMARGDSR